jgi:NAD(P)-dependent dehydrogenase (short-subunit alcohol dehydrogenase family)
MVKMKRFPRKRVVITGAGSGLGRALSIEFARRGWHIGVSDSDEARADQTAHFVRQHGGTPLVIPCDVTVAAQLESMAALLEAQWDGTDVIINNAGIAAAGCMEKIPLETWDRIMAVNLKSVIYGCRTFIPVLERQGGGHIVNVASCAGFASLPEMSCYNVTKAGVIALSETLRSELVQKKIGVTVAVPTFFKSNLLDQMACTDERQRELANAYCSKSRTSADDVARDLLRGIEQNKMYVMTQADGKLLWFLKRLAPEFYFKLLVWIYKKGLSNRYLGIE